MWINKSLFSDAYYNSQKSDKIGSKIFRPFEVKSLIGKNSVHLDLPTQMKIHPVIHVVHTRPYISQPPDLSQAIPLNPDSVSLEEGEELVVKDVLNHRKR